MVVNVVVPRADVVVFTRLCTQTPALRCSGMYVTCGKCNQPWCWQCGQWGPKVHHVFKCNDARAAGWGAVTKDYFVRGDGGIFRGDPCL